MSEIPKAIQPIYQCEANQPILLYEGEMELVEDSQVTLGSGKIEFTWLPKTGIKFSIHYDSYGIADFEDIPDSDKDILLRFSIPELSIEKLFAKANIFQKSSSDVITSFNGYLSRFELGNGSELSYVVFHLTNFINYFAPRIKRHIGEDAKRLIFESTEWRITIDSISDEIINSLEDNSGYVITHTGRLERIDGCSFSSQDAEEVLLGLNYFFSFVVGRWVSPALPVGFNSTDQRVWEKWLHYCTGYYRGSVDSWFPYLNSTDVSVAFTGFMELWINESWKEVLKLLISWYIESNISDIEQAIPMTQFAFELLTWIILVDDQPEFNAKNVVVQKKFKAKKLDDMNTAKRIRLLFSSLGIPVTMSLIPRTQHLFLDYLKSMLLRLKEEDELEKEEKRKANKSIKEDNYLLDCVRCITEIRNRIVHPEKKVNSETILKYSTPERQEVSNLCIWYLELCLLRLFGYEGIYRNRLYKPLLKSEGDNYDKVPWTL